MISEKFVNRELSIELLKTAKDKGVTLPLGEKQWYKYPDDRGWGLCDSFYGDGGQIFAYDCHEIINILKNNSKNLIEAISSPDDGAERIIYFIKQGWIK